MIDLDLDILAPEDKTVKLNGKLITIQQPTTANFFKIVGIGQKMANIDTDGMSAEDVEKLVEEAKQIVSIVAPDIANQNLNFSQLIALINLISEMTMPKHLKELQDRGITADIEAISKKKVVSAPPTS